MSDFNDVLNTALLTFRSCSDVIKALILLTPASTVLGLYALRIWSRSIPRAWEKKRHMSGIVDRELLRAVTIFPAEGAPLPHERKITALIRNRTETGAGANGYLRASSEQNEK